MAITVDVIPNPYVDPSPWGSLRIGGVLICNPDDPLSPQVISYEGLVLEDEYNVQRPIGKSFAVAVFKGTKLLEGPVITIEAPTKEAFSMLWALWQLMAPSPAEIRAAQWADSAVVPAATAGDGVGGASTSTVPPEDDGADKDGWPRSPPGFNPGPKPPTLTIECPQMAWLGMHSCSRRTWEGPIWRPEAGSWRVKLGVIQARNPANAAVGAQSPATGGAAYTSFQAKGATSAAGNAAAAKAELGASPV